MICKIKHISDNVFTDKLSGSFTFGINGLTFAGAGSAQLILMLANPYFTVRDESGNNT